MIPHSKTHITQESKDSILKVMESGLLVKGKKHKLFESKFGELVEKNYVDLTSSGAMAFFKILSALDISEGDEVLIPNYICSSLLGPIKFLKAIPVIYDNKKNSWLSDNEIIKEKITVKTKLILINHTFGFLFNGIESLKNSISSEVALIEDCCHALSSKSLIGTTKISKHSLCSFYSFNATKMIATGEGGAIATDESAFFEKISQIKLGDNLSDLSCSLGLQQLESLPKLIDKRLEIATLYNRNFGFQNLNHESLFYRYPILVDNNQVFLNSRSISYKLGVDTLISDHIEVKGVQNSKNIMSKIVSVPLYPALEDREVDNIIQTTKRLLNIESN